MLQTRQLELFGRTLNATANHLISGSDTQYRNALGEIHRELRKPALQKSVFALSQANPRELVRSRFSSNEIQQRALAHVPDELLKNIPAPSTPYSLFQGYQATQPDNDDSEQAARKPKHGRHASRHQLNALEAPPVSDSHRKLQQLQQSHDKLSHRLDMMSIRKTMCSSEIKELDKKLASLQAMRKTIVDRLADLEHQEVDLEFKVDEAKSNVDDAKHSLSLEDPPSPPDTNADDSNQPAASSGQDQDSPSFMSESVYASLPSPKSVKKRRHHPRRISMPILHEHLAPGTRIREFQAHDDNITAMDFDVPFGTMVTAALDDTMRVWDLNAGRCVGMLEGHLSSVRCIQIHDNIVASGSNDATIRLWDLNQADYPQPQPSSSIHTSDEQSQTSPDDPDVFASETPQSPPNPSTMADCPLYTLSSHVAEITALHFQGNTLISGSADKTLRQWDLETGRCVQTLDVLWAAAQASSTAPSSAVHDPTNSWYRPNGDRFASAAAASSSASASSSADADFVGALQVFQSAVACGTADSVIRLWDLRSGMVQRSLIGHTGPVTALQFDDVHLVTGSLDRSIRVSLLSFLSMFTCCLLNVGEEYDTDAVLF